MLPSDKQRRLEQVNAERMGILAGRGGTRMEECPYFDREDLAEAWRSGWKRAQKDRATIARLLGEARTATRPQYTVSGLPGPHDSIPLEDPYPNWRPVVDSHGFRGLETTDAAGHRTSLEFARPPGWTRFPEDLPPLPEPEDPGWTDFPNPDAIHIAEEDEE